MSTPVLIAGPTASGKSGLALALAERFNSCVINADALQVYAEWRILTARPSPEDEARAPHRLYGHVPVKTTYSVGAWLRDIAGALAACADSGLRPIITGGTGLYFKALTEGLAEIPAIPLEIRAETEADFAEMGRDAFAARLADKDPATHAAIDAQNPARLKRAWEVLAATGEGLATWRTRTPAPLLPIAEATPILLTPERAELYVRCDQRLDQMFATGALEEARAVMALSLPSDAPSMKAVGAPELMAHLRGELTLDEAKARAKTATRNYAKRQLTWFRNQMRDWPAYPSADAALANFRDLPAA